MISKSDIFFHKGKNRTSKSCGNTEEGALGKLHGRGGI